MSTGQQFVTLPYALERKAPPFESNDIKYPEALVRFFLRRFTRPGDKVLDPFAGLGTTLFVAEEMRRIPFGVERDIRRHQWVAGQLKHWRNLLHGDSRKLASFGLPKIDFSMTSPPYMPRNHRWNPLCAGNPVGAGYDSYLEDIQHIFRQVARIMKRGSIVVVQADNLPGRSFTPLVRDVSLAIGEVFRPKAEIVVAWEGGPRSMRHTHCLVFKAV
jgi:hypothetical protein